MLVWGYTNMHEDGFMYGSIGATSVWPSMCFHLAVSFLWPLIRVTCLCQLGQQHYAGSLNSARYWSSSMRLFVSVGVSEDKQEDRARPRKGGAFWKSKFDIKIQSIPAAHSQPDSQAACQSPENIKLTWVITLLLSLLAENTKHLLIVFLYNAIFRDSLED